MAPRGCALPLTTAARGALWWCRPGRRNGANRTEKLGVMRRFFRFCFYLIFILAPTALADDHTELLSIHAVIPPNQYIDRFDVVTWGVSILKVCRVLPGWTITAGTFGDPEGQLSGEAKIGVAYINSPSSLTQLFLVRVHQYQREAKKSRVAPDGSYTIHPASFSGKLEMGTYGDSPRLHKNALTAEDFVRTPATNCP